jgi:hypothetical protein
LAEGIETELLSPDHGRIKRWLRRLVPGARAQDSFDSLLAKLELKREDSGDASTRYSSPDSSFVESEAICKDLEENVEVSTGLGRLSFPDAS